MKQIKSALLAGLFVVAIAPSAVAQAAGEGGGAAGATPVETGGAPAEAPGSAGEATALGGGGAGGDDSAGAGGEVVVKPVPTTRKYDLLENDARACSFHAPVDTGAAGRGWLVAAALGAALLRRRRPR